MIFQTNWRVKLSPPLLKPDFAVDPGACRRFIIETTSRRRTDRIAALVDASRGKVHQELSLIPSLVAEFPCSALEELARHRQIRKIWHDAPVYARLDSAVPAVRGDLAQKMGLTGKEVTIAILDTGIYPHRDLVTPENRIFGWYDFINQKNSPYDDNGHGTHVAGIIAGNGTASRRKYKGMAPEAVLVGVKALDKDGTGTVSKFLAAIEWCLAHQNEFRIKVINLSVGGPAQESYRLDPLCRATTMAWNKGIFVCAAAGNEGPGAKTIETPGINPKIMTVGNVDNRETLTDIDDRLSPSSSRGPTIDNITKPNIVAPGTDITSTWPGGGYRTLSGTSMSTPMVAGAAALIIQKWPAIKPDQLKFLLMKNAHNLGLGPNLQGAGVLNLEKIFNAAPNYKMNPRNFKEIFLYQLLENLMNALGIKPTLFLKKRDEAARRALLDLVSFI
ncbi:MAG: S8 family peptidase [Bacillota bacterium]